MENDCARCGTGVKTAPSTPQLRLRSGYSIVYYRVSPKCPTLGNNPASQVSRQSSRCPAHNHFSQRATTPRRYPTRLLTRCTWLSVRQAIEGPGAQGRRLGRAWFEAPEAARSLGASYRNAPPTAGFASVGPDRPPGHPTVDHYSLSCPLRGHRTGNPSRTSTRSALAAYELTSRHYRLKPRGGPDRLTLRTTTPS